MTLDDVLDLNDYWRLHPPVQWMVQSYLGIDPDQQKASDMSVADLKALTGSWQ